MTSEAEKVLAEISASQLVKSDFGGRVSDTV